MSAFRVIAGANPSPRKVYDGDDIHAALQAFWDHLPEPPETFLLRHAIHLVTGEGMVECRGQDGKMAAALYGITAAEWQAANAFFDDPDDGEEVTLQ